MALDAGSIRSQLAAELDSRGFKAFDAEIDKARAKAANDIVVEGKAKVDDGSFRKLNRVIGDANRQTTFLQRSISTLKWPALIAGAGGAAQGLSALGAAAAGLTGALGPLSGALVVLPATFGAIGQAAGVTAVAGVGNLTEAVGGLNEKLDRESEAFKRLSPQGQRFAETLDRLKAPLRNLQGDVQRPLFGGMARGLEAVMKNLGPFQAVLRATARVMGSLAERAGEMFGERGFGRDFEKIGRSNARLFERMGLSGLKFGDAMRHVLVAARPLIRWLGDLSVGWAESAREAAKAGRETGKLGEFFDQTRRTMERVGSIAGSLAEAFYDIGKAAAPLGRQMLRAFDDSAKSFAKWTGSMRGQNALADYFKDARRPIFEIGRLMGDTTKAFFSLAETPGLTKLIRALRIDLLPVLVDVVRTTTKAFAPVLIDALTSFLKLMGDLAGTSGPLTMFVKVIGWISEGLHRLLESNPAVKSMTVTMLGFASVLSALGLGRAISELAGFAKGWRTLQSWVTRAGSSMIVLRAQLLGLAVMGKVTAAFAAARVALMALTRTARIAMLTTGIGALIVGAGLLIENWDKVKVALDAVWKWMKTATRNVGRFIGNRVDDIVGFFSNLPDKIRDAIVGLGRIIRAPFAWALDEIKGIVEEIKQAFDDITGVLGFGGPGGGLSYEDVFSKPSERQHGGPVEARTPYVVGEAGPELFVPRGAGQIISNDRMRRGVGSPLSEKAVKDTEERSRKIEKAVSDRYEKASAEARKRTRELEGDSKKSWKSIDSDHDKRTRSIQKRTDERFSQVRDTARERLADVVESMRRTMGSADQAAFKGLTYIQSAISKALSGLGSKPAEFSIEKPKGFAGGGMIAGQGRQDTVPLLLGMAAPGEAILTRHQQRWVEAALRNTFGMGLGDLFASERRPHSYARGGEIVDMSRGELAGLIRSATRPKRFARGGFTEPPGDPGAEIVAGGIARQVGQFLSRYRMDLTAGYDPGGGHVSPGHNVTGTALDVIPNAAAGGTWGTLEQGLRWAISQGMKVLYGTAGIGTPWENHGRGHHAHIEWGGGASLAPMGLKRLLVEGPGPVRDIIQGGLDRVRSAGTRFINRKVGMHGASVGAGGVLSRSQAMAVLARALRITGHYSQQNLQALYGRAVQESGLNPSIVNNWDSNAAAGTPSIGLLQTIGPTFDAYKLGRFGNIRNPLHNAIAAIRYMIDRYGQIVGPGPGGYARGGFLGRIESLLNPGGTLNLGAAAARGERVLGKVGFRGRLGTLARLSQLRQFPAGQRHWDRAHRAVTRALPREFAQLAAGAQLAPSAASGVLGGLVRRLERAGVAASSYRSSAAGIRNTIAVSRAQNPVFASFGQGGVLPGGVAAAGAPPVNVTLVVEGDAGLLDLRVRKVIVERERASAREAGLSRLTPSATGRRATY